MNPCPAIHCDVSNNVGRLTISNPRKRNAITYAMWQALPECVARCEADPDIRAIVLTGADNTFCSGADISEFGAKRSDQSGVRAYAYAASLANNAILRATKPTIALLRGACYGGGVTLALACDVRLASANVHFSVPAARLGLGYVFDDVALLASRIGMAATADLLFTARVFDAVQARNDGLVREYFADDVFDEKAETYLARIVENAPLTLMAVTAALRELTKPADARELARVAKAVEQCFNSEDYAEGRRAFTERRKPQFRGR